MKIFSNDYEANLPKNQWPTKGGPAKFSRLLSDEFTKRGHLWVGLVAKYTGENKIDSRHIKGVSRKSWWIINFPSTYVYDRFNLIKKYQNPRKSGVELINEIKKVLVIEKPDLVFINGNSSFVWTYLIAAHSLKIPIVVHHAGIWGIEIDLYSDFFSKAGIKVLKEQEIDFAKLSTFNIFLNETSKNYYLKNIYKIPKEKTTIIPLPSEISTSKKLTKKTKKRNLNVGIVARWDRIKNHRAFLEIAKLSKLNGENWMFHSVTKIPDTQVNLELKNEYKNIIKVIEPMDNKELRKFYRKMDFMLLPSIFDVSPHVVIEAASEGVPTFISKNVGYADLFKKHSLNNFIVDFSKPKTAFKKIQENSGKKFPIKFINVLNNIHNTEKVINQYINLFSNLKK